jgi:crotonobetainyl-CoA:carnitine CoA-transferase CaiB-like acyl-CoA transferase
VTQPLAGIRVLDFTHAAAGPFATMLLADMGADIVKVERPPRGDGARSMGAPLPGFAAGESDYFQSLNRNKRSVGIDLSRPEGAALAKRLVRDCDIVAQNFRPGVMERLGLGFDDLRGERPGLIYCSISAFGSRGPWAAKPANDIIMQSISGLMGVTGEMGGGPVRIGAPISDFATGLFALSAMLAALCARGDHPEGQHLEIAMLEASFNMMCNYIPSVVATGFRVPRLGRGHAQIVPYQAFACADGEYVMVGAFTTNFWHNLCDMLGRSDWKEDPRFSTNRARLANRAELTAMLDDIFAQAPRAQWVARLTEADVPNSPILELDEAVASEQAAYLGSIETIDDAGRAIPVVRSPIRTEAWSEVGKTAPPTVGRDTVEVLGALMSSEDIRRLAEAQVVAGPDL